ncbi:MAG: hypothetical protein DDT19_01059 [Syntrophomonadaceae bacterium]|nr:hypothetical protein [Bacillota bacterium]
MLIRMLTTAASPAGVILIGTVVELDDELAQAFISGGYAEAVVSPIIEAAAMESPEETAVLPEAKKKG